METAQTAANPFGLTGESPSNVLIHALESFGECEASAVLVVFVDKQNGVTIKSNARRCVALGLLQMAQDMVRGVGDLAGK